MAGIHSDLRNQIAAIRSLRVPSRTSTAKYQQGTKSIPEIAKELGVDVVLEPDIYEIGDSVWIQVRLIKAFPEEQQIWSASFKTEMGNVLSLYDIIADAIAVEMNVANLEDQTETKKVSRVDPEAYKAYIEGLGHLYKTTPDGINRALDYFNLSIEKDPNYSPAYTGVAMVYGFKAQMGLISAFEAAPHVQEATAKALSLGSTHPEIHYLLAITNAWGNWKWDEANKEFKITLDMNPNNAEARAYYAHYLNITNRSDEAETQMNIALELETGNWLVQALYGMYLNHAREYNKALNRLKRILENDPGNPIALAALWTIYHNMGEYDKALETAKILYTEKREYRAVERLITGNQEGGYKMAMERVAEVFIEKMDTTYFAPWQIATLYTRAGNSDKAVDWLQKAYDAHDPNMPYISCDPIFDPIASHPGFQKILTQMKLTKVEK
jgi:TolB-like protein/Flp pilus assembly protein TadD